ncbi:restriction endonuclease subunit S [Pelagibacterales bacterium]|nr:restriction endonuclease subunit S [Pelagibacterales bacterium]
MTKFFNFNNLPVITLDKLFKDKNIELGRGDIISKIDIQENKGPYPIYSSSAKNNGIMGKYSKFMFDEEMITWSIDGGGKFFYRPKHKFSVTNVSGFMRVIKGKIDLKYIYNMLTYQHSFLNFDYQFKAHPSVIRELYEVPILPLAEQKKIASILTSVDEVIENTQKQIDKLQNLKKATMNELLTKGIGHTEFKDSELGQIPKSWGVHKLEEIGTFSKGKGISKKDILSEGIPCIRYAEIYTCYDFYIETFKSFISPDTARSSKKLVNNDIIFAGSGETVEEIGKSIAFTLNCEAYASGDSIVMSPFSDLNSIFLSYQLNDCIRRDQLRKLGQGSSVMHIYVSNLKEILICKPPLPEQEKISSILLSFEKLIKKEENKLCKVQDIKKSLMQDLLTGKVRVSVN